MLRVNLKPNFSPVQAFSRKVVLKILRRLIRKITRRGPTTAKLSEYGATDQIVHFTNLRLRNILEFLEWGMSTVYIRVDRVLGAIFSENYRFDIAWRS